MSDYLLIPATNKMQWAEKLYGGTMEYLSSRPNHVLPSGYTVNDVLDVRIAVDETLSDQIKVYKPFWCVIKVFYKKDSVKVSSSKIIYLSEDIDNVRGGLNVALNEEHLFTESEGVDVVVFDDPKKGEGGIIENKGSGLLGLGKINLFGLNLDIAVLAAIAIAYIYTKK